MDLLKLFSQAPDAFTCKAGETLFNEGDEAQNLFVVLEGVVEIRRGTEVLERSQPGSIVGEMALIGDHRRTATAVAATDCRLAPINERRFLFLVQETPFFALHVMRVMVERLKRRESRQH